MAEHRIAPLVPPTLAPGSGRRHLAGRGAQLKVGALPERPRAGTLVYGMGRLDQDGRPSNRATIDTLGWTAGDCLNIALVSGWVVVHRDPSGAFEIVLVAAGLRRRDQRRHRMTVDGRAGAHRPHRRSHGLAFVAC